MIKRMTPVLVASLLRRLLPASTAPTASLKGYGLSWWTADCEGCTLFAAGSCSLAGTVGHPDTAQVAGGDCVLSRAWTASPDRLRRPTARHQFLSGRFTTV